MYNAPYGYHIPNVLPAFREVPLNYTTPASDQPHPPPQIGGHPHHPAPPPHLPSYQHHNRHVIDLTTLRSKVSIPSTAPAPAPATAPTDATDSTKTPAVDASHPTAAPPYFHLPPTWLHQFPFYHSAPTAPISVPAHAPLATNQPWIPCADVRETSRAYFLEIEVPGLSPADRDTISVTWLSSRTVMVSGTVKRPILSLTNDEDGGELRRVESPVEGAEAPEGEGKREEEEPVLLFGERAIGEWRRNFILPADCDLGVDPGTGVSGEPLKFDVENGIVTVEIPKVK